MNVLNGAGELVPGDEVGIYLGDDLVGIGTLLVRADGVVKIAMPAHTPEYRARIMCYGVYDDSQRHEEAYVDEFTAHPDGWRRKSSSDQRNYFIRALPDSVRVLHGRTDGGGRVIIVIITDPEIGPDEAEMLFAARDLPES